MILKGQKVILRPIKFSDAERFVEWFNDPKFNKFMSVRKATLRKEIKWIKNLAKKKKTDMVFAIETRNGIHIGSTGLHGIDKNKQATFGIMIGDRNYWNKGFGSDAARTILDYAFTELKLHRIELLVYNYNHRAFKVYKHLGFKKEGMKREHNFYKGKYHDTILMSILDREWRKRFKI